MRHRQSTVRPQRSLACSHDLPEGFVCEPLRRFRCSLPAGRYRFEVRATDEAGNAKVTIGTSVLVVRQ